MTLSTTPDIANNADVSLLEGDKPAINSDQPSHSIRTIIEETTGALDKNKGNELEKLTARLNNLEYELFGYQHPSKQEHCIQQIKNIFETLKTMPQNPDTDSLLEKAELIRETVCPFFVQFQILQRQFLFCESITSFVLTKINKTISEIYTLLEKIPESYVFPRSFKIPKQLITNTDVLEIDGKTYMQVAKKNIIDCLKIIEINNPQNIRKVFDGRQVKNILLPK